MKLSSLLVLPLLVAVVFQQTLSAKLPPIRAGAIQGYLNPAEGGEVIKRCLLQTATQRIVQSSVVFPSFTHDVTIVETVPVLTPVYSNLVRVVNEFAHTSIERPSTIVSTSSVYDFHTSISVVSIPPVIRTAEAFVTSTSTNIQIRDVVITSQIIQQTVQTRTAFITELATRAIAHTQIAYSTAAPVTAYTTSLVTTVIDIPVDRTPAPLFSTLVFTLTSTSFTTTTITPLPITSHRRVTVSTVSTVYTEAMIFHTSTLVVPVTTTAFRTVTRTIVDTATALRTDAVTSTVTKTVRKVIPSTITHHVSVTTQVTVQRHVPVEVVHSATKVTQIIRTSRRPDQVVHQTSVVLVTDVFTSTHEYQPPTLTKVATVVHKCETETLAPQGYNYISPRF